MIACEKGDVEIVRTLLKAGADINATSKTVSFIGGPVHVIFAVLNACW